MIKNNEDPDIIALDEVIADFNEVLSDFDRSLCRLRQESVWQRVRSGLFVSDEMIVSAGLEPSIIRACEEASVRYVKCTPEQWSNFRKFIDSLTPEQLIAQSHIL